MLQFVLMVTQGPINSKAKPIVPRDLPVLNMPSATGRGPASLGEKDVLLKNNLKSLVKIQTSESKESYTSCTLDAKEGRLFEGIRFVRLAQRMPNRRVGVDTYLVRYKERYIIMLTGTKIEVVHAIPRI